MMAQIRPDVARFAEESVVNLKELETRIDVLKNDLACLCASIGHHEAARVALTPPRSAVASAPIPIPYPNWPAFAPMPFGSFPNVPTMAAFPTVPGGVNYAPAFAVPNFGPFTYAYGPPPQYR